MGANHVLVAPLVLRSSGAVRRGRRPNRAPRRSDGDPADEAPAASTDDAACIGLAEGGKVDPPSEQEKSCSTSTSSECDSSATSDAEEERAEARPTPFARDSQQPLSFDSLPKPQSRERACIFGTSLRHRPHATTRRCGRCPTWSHMPPVYHPACPAQCTVCRFDLSSLGSRSDPKETLSYRAVC